MKIKNLTFLTINIIAWTSTTITPKFTAEDTSRVEVIKSNRNLSKYHNFFAVELFKKPGTVLTSTIKLQDTPENISQAKSKYGIENFSNNNFIITPIDNTKRIVLYISPLQNHALSVKDYDRYLSNNIVVLGRSCELNSPLKNHTKGHKNSKTSVGAFIRWISGSKKNPYTKPYKFCSLLSDNNTLIDIYVYKHFGCDGKHYFTSHPTPIAVLIDEKGNILQILDNVQSEEDIFNAFGI